MLQRGSRNPHHGLRGLPSTWYDATHTVSTQITADTTGCPGGEDGGPAHHPFTGAEPGVFGKYWSLPCTLSLHWASLKDPASVPVSPTTAQRACVQVRPCRSTPRAQRLLLSSALHRGRWPATATDPSPLPRPQSLWRQVGISSRSRSSQPREPGKPHLPSRLLAFGCRERAWWAELLCAWNHRIWSPQSSLPGVPLEGRSRGRWMAQRPHEACGSLKQFKLQSEMPGSLAHHAWEPLCGPSHPISPTPLLKKERFVTCCRSGRDTLSLCILRSELTKHGSPGHHLPCIMFSISLKHLSLEKQRGEGALSCPATEIAQFITKGRDGPPCRRATVNDHLSQTLPFPSPVLPRLEWSLLSAKMPVYLQEEQEMVASWLKVLPQITGTGKDVETQPSHMGGRVVKWCSCMEKSLAVLKEQKQKQNDHMTQ